MKTSVTRGGMGKRQQGIALVIVMLVIVVLGALVGGFAYSMRVETRLAGNSSLESDMEWLGRSGIELARYLLGEQANMKSEGYTSLNQRWADGVGSPDYFLEEIDLHNINLGVGHMSVEIIDAESKLNLNVAIMNDEMLEKIFFLMGESILDSSTIKDSMRDWIDLDDQTGLSGFETDDYLASVPPYVAKNGPLDSLPEVLMIRGMSDELYYGTNSMMQFEDPGMMSATDRIFGDQYGTFSASFEEVFTTVGGPRVNINTASSQVLRLLPGIDPTVASGILEMRAGFDGMDGTEDDIPFRSPGEIISAPGMTPELARIMSRFIDVKSTTFEVFVDAEIGGFKRTYKALLFRSGTQVQQLTFTWE